MTMPDPSELADGPGAVAAADALEAQPATAGAAEATADPAEVVQPDQLVTICHQSTGEQRDVGAAALPFFLNQGFDVLPGA